MVMCYLLDDDNPFDGDVNTEATSHVAGRYSFALLYMRLSMIHSPVAEPYMRKLAAPTQGSLPPPPKPQMAVLSAERGVAVT